MLKRSVFPGLVSGLALVAALSACTTVSVVPGVSTVETGISSEQSALRDAATQFTEKAKTRGWINPSSGLFNLARVLVDGQDDNKGKAQAHTYAGFIGAAERDAQAVLATVLTDGKDAEIALSNVSAEASALLAIDLKDRSRTARKDLISYERILVQAGQARRAFADALGQAGLETNADAIKMLESLDGEIETARSLAGRLATEYAGRTVSGAVS